LQCSLKRFNFLQAQEILLRGEAIPEELAAKLLMEKINSPEVAHHGESSGPAGTAQMFNSCCVKSN
jgi:hypothetical protein